MLILLRDGYCIRPFRACDAEDLYAVLGDPAVMRYIEPPFSRQQTASFLEREGLTDPPRVLALADDGDRVVGQVIFHPYDSKSWELGWILGREHWGRGLAAASTAALVERCREMGAARCVIECHPDQTVTRHIAEKCGFRFAGEADGLAVYLLHL